MTRSASLHARHTRSRGASNVRVTTTSCVSFFDIRTSFFGPADIDCAGRETYVVRRPPMS